VFCGPACRTAFHTAARRWAEGAVAVGVLTIADIRKGRLAACTLLPEGISPVPIFSDEQPASVAPAESPGEAADLLDDLLIALLDLPGNAWPDLAVALPDEVFNRVDRWMEVRFVS
jgi:hypothetical protein